MKTNQSLLTNLKDWYFRQVTSSANVIKRVYSSLIDMKEELDPAIDEETQAIMDDLDLEEAGEFPQARHQQNPLNRVTLYAFTLSDQQTELLCQANGVPEPSSSVPASPESMIALKNALEMMIQRMDERYTVPFPYWLFRTIPSLFMQEPILMKWASCVFPMSYLERVAEIAPLPTRTTSQPPLSSPS